MEQVDSGTLYILDSKPLSQEYSTNNKKFHFNVENALFSAFLRSCY